MAFDQSTITGGPVCVPCGRDFLIVWSCSATPPVTYQVYLDRRLYWTGNVTRTRIIISNDGGNHEIHVGTCLASESHSDLSSSLPAPVGGTGTRASFTWLGGTFLDSDISGFFIFQGSAPGVAASTSSVPVASVAAYPGGIITDGFGLGGFGQGGFGQAASSYSFTSVPLSAGTWDFAIVAVDAAGNFGSVTTASATINGPPLPPLIVNGQRVNYTYSASTHEATLSWFDG